MSHEKVCASCGHIGKPVPQALSSFTVDALLWLYFAFLAGMSQLLPLLLVPLIWTGYHIIRFNTVKCPVCESLDMVSKNSRRGKVALADPNPVHVLYKAHH